MSGSPHIYGVVVTGGERLQLLRLVEQHGDEHLAHLVRAAPDMGTIRELAATVETPERASAPASETRALG